VSGGPIVETCSTLGKKCEPTGTANCEITINVGGTPTSTVGYSTNACTVPLRKTAGSGAIDDGRSTIYQTYDNYYAN
jgi:hypothetical protein